MSVISRSGTKVVMPRTGPGHFWERMHEGFGGDEVAWRRFVMLSIREGLHWPLSWIGEGFGVHKGTVSREVRRARHDVRQFLISEGWEFP